MTAKEYFEKTHPINIGVVTNDDCIKTMDDYLEYCLSTLIKLNKHDVVGRSEQLVCDCTHTQACKICAKSKDIDWDDAWDEAN